jgi:hypothetical protein
VWHAAFFASLVMPYSIMFIKLFIYLRFNPDNVVDVKQPLWGTMLVVPTTLGPRCWMTGCHLSLGSGFINVGVSYIYISLSYILYIYIFKDISTYICINIGNYYMYIFIFLLINLFILFIVYLVIYLFMWFYLFILFFVILFMYLF